LTKNLVDGFSVEALSVPLLIAIGAAFVIQAIISGLSIYLLSAVGQKIVASLRETMWLKLVRLPVTYYDEHSSGETVSRVVNDTSVGKDLITDHFRQFITGMLSVIGVDSLLLIIDWKMPLVMLIAVPHTLLLIIPLGKRMVTISRGLQD